MYTLYFHQYWEIYAALRKKDQKKISENLKYLNTQKLLRIAAQMGSCDVINFISKIAPTDVNKFYTDFHVPVPETPIFAACECGGYETVQLLVKLRADVTYTNDLGECPLQVTIEKSDWSRKTKKAILETLLNAGQTKIESRKIKPRH